MDPQEAVAQVSAVLLDAIRNCEAEGLAVAWPHSLLLALAARLPGMRISTLGPTDAGCWEARGAHDGRRLGTVRRRYATLGHLAWVAQTRSGARPSRRNGVETVHDTFEAAAEHLRLELLALGWVMAVPADTAAPTDPRIASTWTHGSRQPGTRVGGRVLELAGVGRLPFRDRTRVSSVVNGLNDLRGSNEPE